MKELGLIFLTKNQVDFTYSPSLKFIKSERPGFNKTAIFKQPRTAINFRRQELRQTA